MLNKKRNSVLNLNFLSDKNYLKLAVFMSTTLIILCNINKLIVYKTKNLQTLIIKTIHFFLILANASCPIETIKTLNPVYVLYVSLQTKFNLDIFTFFTVLDFHSNAIFLFTWLIRLLNAAFSWWA